MPGGWDGCVYARYVDDSDQTNDADTTLGTTATWPGWEPIPSREGEPGSFFSPCYAQYWNNDQNYPGVPVPNPGWPSPPVPSYSDNCDDCPSIGILPLQTSDTTVKNMINALQTFGATDAPQGLFWAWEVLMPGDPFNQAKLNPPFQRAQAIVFMTDGENYGSAGDAYHGWFGPQVPAGTTTAKGDLTLPDGSTTKNNLNGHLLQLAQKIKGLSPLDPSAVKIYVIQYNSNTPGLSALLQQVATQPQAPYYYNAPDDAALATAFDQIAASLSALRIVK
jgi:hypothetical protein